MRKKNPKHHFSLTKAPQLRLLHYSRIQLQQQQRQTPPTPPITMISFLSATLVLSTILPTSSFNPAFNHQHGAPPPFHGPHQFSPNPNHNEYYGNNNNNNNGFSSPLREQQVRHQGGFDRQHHQQQRREGTMNTNGQQHQQQGERIGGDFVNRNGGQGRGPSFEQQQRNRNGGGFEEQQQQQRAAVMEMNPIAMPYERAMECVSNYGMCDIDEMMDLARELEEYQGCFLEYGPEACEEEIQDRQHLAEELFLQSQMELQELNHFAADGQDEMMFDMPPQMMFDEDMEMGRGPGPMEMGRGPMGDMYRRDGPGGFGLDDRDGFIDVNARRN
eukprot:g6329.t1 g6329   contig23:210757-211991(-)